MPSWRRIPQSTVGGNPPSPKWRAWGTDQRRQPVARSYRPSVVLVGPIAGCCPGNHPRLCSTNSATGVAALELADRGLTCEPGDADGDCPLSKPRPTPNWCGSRDAALADVGWTPGLPPAWWLDRGLRRRNSSAARSRRTGCCPGPPGVGHRTRPTGPTNPSASTRLIVAPPGHTPLPHSDLLANVGERSRRPGPYSIALMNSGSPKRRAISSSLRSSMRVWIHHRLPADRAPGRPGHRRQVGHLGDRRYRGP